MGSPIPAGPRPEADFEPPVDPPIPIPDVPGAEADERGLPKRSELTLGQRAVVDASVVADLGLRTGIASLVGAAMLPPVVAGVLRGSDLKREREHLGFYADLAAQHDADLSFPAPDSKPRVSVQPANPIARRVAHGDVQHVQFQSSYEARNPDMRNLWRGLNRNNVVHAQHWRHDDGPHPTLCVIHGFLGSPYLFNGLFFSLPWFYRTGFDVLLYTLPFHGRRAERFSPFSGYGFFSNGMAGMAEAMAQAVYDFRSVLDYLESTGVDKMALTGMSLGGYTSSLIASADDRLQAVIPNVPVVNPESAFDDWWPANMLVEFGRHASGIESVPISHEVRDGVGSLAIPGVLESAMEPYRSADGTVTTLRDSIFSTVPGSPAWVSKASKTWLTLPSYGMEWEFEGRNAIQSEWKMEYSA